MARVPLSAPTQVLRCGGALTYQLLMGRELARGDPHATRSAKYAYLVVNTQDRFALAVDAAWDVDGLYALAARLGVWLLGAVYSSCRVDHCGGDAGDLDALVAGAKEVLGRGGRLWAGRDDVELFTAHCGLAEGTVGALGDGDVLECGDLVLHVLHTPGPTPGSICVFGAPRCLSPRGELEGRASRAEVTVEAASGLLFTGDTLFVGTCGRTNFPGSDAGLVVRALARIGQMDPAVVLLPGHNYALVPYTTVGAAFAQNESLQLGLGNVPSPPPLPACLACGSCRPCGPRGFVAGRKFRIAGLESEAGKVLNGEHGVLQGFSAKGRYILRLMSTSETKLLKPENLEGVHARAGNCPGRGNAPIQGTALASLFDGAISTELLGESVRPWRLRHEERVLYGPPLASMAACAAVRIVLCASSHTLQVVASVSAPEGTDAELLRAAGGYPLEYDLYVDGVFFARRQLGAASATGGRHVVLFEGLPTGHKELELWLPTGFPLDVHAIDCGQPLGSAVQRPLGLDQRKVWLCYGSSITHGGVAAAAPSGTWAAVCAKLANLRLINLGFGGECFLDPAVARVIRDTPCDAITMKIGINILTMAALTRRTFRAAALGFIQMVRDGHPRTPFVVVSAIWYGPCEQKAPVSAAQFLTLAETREQLKDVVSVLRNRGDERLFYRDGLELLGETDKELLYDGLHPDAWGNALMGQRFATLEFGPTGRLLPGRAMEQGEAATTETTAGGRREALVGSYLCRVPQDSPCRLVVKAIEGSLVAVSDRSDWAPARLDLRGDLVLLRGSPEVWGRLEGRSVSFSNGISWTRVSGPSSPRLSPLRDH